MALEAERPKIREASLVHRVFCLTPGYAPNWAYACCGGCEGGLDCVIAIGLVIAGVKAGKEYGWWILVVSVAVSVSWLDLIGRFAGRERFGRARIHRKECVWCGQTDVARGSVCPACSRRG
jgi:hypothetical protein